jgi:Double zinc ribbon
MDAIDRMFTVLARTVRDTQPRYLSQPFEVAELYQTLLPYRHFRRELALDTNEDYEITLMQLLSGARGYLIVDDRMRDALEHELRSPNPDSGAFRQFADAQIALSPAALQRQTQTPEGTADPARATGSTVRLSTPSSHAAAAAAADGARCRYCSGKLPQGRKVVFCPSCGQNLTVVNCSACGAELELGWKFCVACGRPTAPAT